MIVLPVGTALRVSFLTRRYKKMTQEIPYWLHSMRPQFSRELPAPVNNLKNASRNVPAYLGMMMHTGLLPRPIPTKAEIEAAQLAARRKSALPSRIRSAARKMGLKPSQIKSAATTSANSKPAWLATRDYFLKGY
jgi:hypothetical protein